MIDHIENAISKAENGQTKLSGSLLSLPGMSSTKVKTFLNELLSFNNSNYLEIGCWKGSTLCCALYKNNPNSIVAIDNFSEWGGPRGVFLANLKTHVAQDITFLDEECFNIN